MSHILAVSGMHVSYVVLGISFILTILKINKRISKICIIVFLIFFIFLTGEMPSVKRSCIMAILSIFANLLYRKSDIITNISIALLIILIQNPFSIIDIGLILSFSATIGIVLFNNTILNLLQNISRFIKNDKSIENVKANDNDNDNYLNNKYKFSMGYKMDTRITKNKTSNKSKIFIKIEEIISVSISAQILILPLSILFFNKLSITFLLSNILVSFLIGIIIILGFISIVFQFQFLFIILNILLNILSYIANIFSNIPISKVIVVTPSNGVIIFYYILVLIIIYLYKLQKKLKKRKLEKMILQKVSRCKTIIYRKKKNIIVGLVFLVIILQILNFYQKDLKIYFIDVGQGDSTLIITPSNKTILIDGGGNLNDEYDVGKNTLLPYLLDRKIKEIDYMMISHFDADHCKRINYNNRKYKSKKGFNFKTSRKL